MMIPQDQNRGNVHISVIVLCCYTLDDNMTQCIICIFISSSINNVCQRQRGIGR